MTEQSRASRVVIIGAGPAGLTAAHELQKQGGAFEVIVIERLQDVGGISRTIEHHGNRMDIGGHRFFSKSDWVMDWWQSILPTSPAGADPYAVPTEDAVLLVRPRLSRIYFLRDFFDYPISLSPGTVRKLGPVRIARIGASYAMSRLRPISPEKNLEDFFINRFGRELYETFFKEYTEKVWGVECQKISPEWGAQRIKGLSITTTLKHALKKVLGRGGDVAQKETETSLIERFLYPKFGPGQMWRVVAERIRAAGGAVRLGSTVRSVGWDGERVTNVVVESSDGATETIPCDHIISTTSVKELIAGFDPPAPAAVREVSDGLAYRDFITVGLLVRKLRRNAYTVDGTPNNLVPDTWIYIQEPGVRLGRLQIFNNWSPAMVADPENTVWLGLEYFCREDDDLWGMSDEALSALAIKELASIDLIDRADALDSHVVRVPKAYPAYFGTYDRFEEVRRFTDRIPNLFLVGRNGMHRYNNQDHSMVTARLAVEAIVSGATDKAPIWTVNVEQEYHEKK